MINAILTKVIKNFRNITNDIFLIFGKND